MRTRHQSSGPSQVLVVFAFLCAQMAFAHPQKGEAVGFLTGFRHPISGLDHVLAMVAVGLWGAQLGSPAIWVLPVAFPMVMAFGGMLGLDGSATPRNRVRNRSFGNSLGLPYCLNCGRPWVLRRRWSASSPYFTGMRTVPNCLPAKAHCFTAWVSLSLRGACTL